MNKIHKNITAIEQKFYSLKAAHQLYNQPTPISQVAEVITYGVVQEKDVQDFLKFTHSAPDIEAREKINEKWYELDFPQMVAFLDKVVGHKNGGKANESAMNADSSLSPKKKKIKQATSQVHENPYIPAKIIRTIKKSIQKRPNSSQKDSSQTKISSPNKLKQDPKQGYYSSLLLIKSRSLKQPEISSPTSEFKKKQIISDLPADFQNLSPKERYAILSKKFGKQKSILQNKFDSIYKHYRKQMFIPFQSFQINDQLLMDLRIFLKYYRQFQVSKKFKTNQAIKHFKKIALNGLWLDDKMFIEIHYKLVDLFELDEKALEEENQTNNDEIDVQKANQIKMEISKKIKNIVQNLVNIKEISDVVSENKIKEIFNNKESNNVIKRIIQAHSGLTKDDVMLKLQERNELRKMRKNILLGNFNQQKFGQLTPGKMKASISKIFEDPTQRLSHIKQSIYDELDLPKLRSREMKKSSIYSSLQMLNIQKQKEKLKELINERESEHYLSAFFRKEKQMFNLPRSKSVTLSKHPNQNQESTGGFTINQTKSINVISRDNVFQRNLSLPRMKFN